MFDKLFGAKKPTITPEQQRELERKRNEMNVHVTLEKMKTQLAQMDAKMDAFEKTTGELTRQALAAKKAGQKDKAMRYLTQIKAMKGQIVKLSSYSTMLTKQIGIISSGKTDAEVANALKQANASMEYLNRQHEQHVEVMQDNAMLNDEFEANQAQIADILKMQTAKITDDLEEDFKKLDELEMLDAMKDYNAKSKLGPTKVPVAQDKSTKYDRMVKDLLN